MVKQFSRHLTSVIFWIALFFSLLSILLSILAPLQTWPLLAFSMGFNIWSIIHSERKGFIRSREMRRAFEPPRHFNEFQVLVIVILVMLQVGGHTYLLFTEGLLS